MANVISYICISSIGNVCMQNQDNFYCNGVFLEDPDELIYPIKGEVTDRYAAMFAVYDGMGGGECGEIASLLAAKCAANVILDENPQIALNVYCKMVSRKIRDYAAAHGISVMGTTAAIAVFTEGHAVLCSIGDSRIYHMPDGKLVKISVDHYGPRTFEGKPPLAQYLGIPESIKRIEPYMCEIPYREGDMFLICTDGLTDGLPEVKIERILKETDFPDSLEYLKDQLSAKGAEDNFTIILCKCVGMKKLWKEI